MSKKESSLGYLKEKVGIVAAISVLGATEGCGTVVPTVLPENGVVVENINSRSGRELTEFEIININEGLKEYGDTAQNLNKALDKYSKIPQFSGEKDGKTELFFNQVLNAAERLAEAKDRGDIQRLITCYIKFRQCLIDYNTTRSMAITNKLEDTQIGQQPTEEQNPVFRSLDKRRKELRRLDPADKDVFLDQLTVDVNDFLLKLGM